MKNRISFRQLDLTELAAHHLFLLKGKDDVIVKIVLQQLTNRFIPLSNREFNYIEIKITPETDIYEIINLCEEMPLFPGKKMVILYEISRLGKKEAKVLMDYFPSLAPSTILVLVQKAVPKKWSKSKKPPAKGKAGDPWEKEAAKYGLLVTCALGAKEIPEWIRQEFKKEELEIEPAALKRLISCTGDDLNFLFGEMEKLKILAHGKPQITDSMVDDLVSIYPSATMFMLVWAIKDKNPAKGLKILKDVTREKNQFFPLSGYLHSAFKGMLKKGSDIPAFKIHQFIDWLYRANLAIKAGKDPDFVMETLILKMCQR